MSPQSPFIFALLAVTSLNSVAAKKVAAIEAADFEPTRRTLADTLVLPNTYHDIPEYLYPYYDENGVGRPWIFGFGTSKTLFELTEYSELDGHF